MKVLKLFITYIKSISFPSKKKTSINLNQNLRSHFKTLPVKIDAYTRYIALPVPYFANVGFHRTRNSYFTSFITIQARMSSSVQEMFSSLWGIFVHREKKVLAFESYLFSSVNKVSSALNIRTWTTGWRVWWTLNRITPSNDLSFRVSV